MTPRSKPTVLMLDGNFTFVQDWARAARQVASVYLGVGVDVGFQPHRPGVDADVAHEFALVSIRRIHLRPSRLFRPLIGQHQAVALRRTIAALEEDGKRPDLIHTHFYGNADGAIRVQDRLQIPFIHTEHSGALAQGRISKQGKRLLFEVCERAHAVFAVSEGLVRQMRSLGIDRDIRIGHNPVDLALFASLPVESRFASLSPVRIVSVGWLLPGKNHAMLLRGFSILLRELPDVTLDIVGDGPMEGELKRLASELNIAERVRFRGRMTRHDVARLLADSHIYAHPSLGESFGVALVEAWASGMPVVTFDVGGVTSLAATIGGRTVSEFTPAALAEAIQSQALQLSATECAAIRSRAETRFDRSNLVRQLRETYSTA